MNEQKLDNYTTMTCRIGRTTYMVRVYNAEGATETAEDKIFRIIRNEAFKNDGVCDIITLPQMSRQSERSA